MVVSVVLAGTLAGTVLLLEIPGYRRFGFHRAYGYYSGTGRSPDAAQIPHRREGLIRAEEEIYAKVEGTNRSCQRLFAPIFGYNVTLVEIVK